MRDEQEELLQVLLEDPFVQVGTGAAAQKCQHSGSNGLSWVEDNKYNVGVQKRGLDGVNEETQQTKRQYLGGQCTGFGALGPGHGQNIVWDDQRSAGVPVNTTGGVTRNVTHQVGAAAVPPYTMMMMMYNNNGMMQLMPCHGGSGVMMPSYHAPPPSVDQQQVYYMVGAAGPTAPQFIGYQFQQQQQQQNSISSPKSGHSSTTTVKTESKKDSAARHCSYRGVSWHKHDRKWTARAWVPGDDGKNGKTVYIGTFKNSVVAAIAVDEYHLLKTIVTLDDKGAINALKNRLNLPDERARHDLLRHEIGKDERDRARFFKIFPRHPIKVN